MNEYCKEVLYHSWGKAPERKQLEREYNRAYYNKNKHKWGVKSASYPTSFVGPKPPGSTTSHTPGETALNLAGSAAMLVPGAAYMYGSGENFVSYAKEDIAIVKKILNKCKNVPVAVAAASKAAVETGKKIAKKILKPFEKFKDPQWWIDWANK